MFGEKICVNEKTELISSHFNLTTVKGNQATYEYDFGSTWTHNILLEKILPRAKGKKYPICVTGRKRREFVGQYNKGINYKLLTSSIGYTC